jgi:hypothetical protein
MPAIRSTADIQKKWTEVTPARAGDFETGVKTPKRDWAANTAAAESAYEEGVQSAISDKRFGRGVKTAGSEKWSRKTLAVGVSRWPTGVRAASEDYAKGFGPYHDVIERTTLPPRFGRGDPRNYQRSEVMGTALHSARTKKS